jgi:DnaK suppressor protein
MRQKIKPLYAHIQEDSSKVADDNDRATLEEEFALELRTRDRERQLIAITKKKGLKIKGLEKHCKSYQHF